MSELRIRLDAPAWDSEFIDADQFLEGLRAADFGDVTAIEIHAEAGGRRIAVEIGRSPPQRTASGSTKVLPVVRLNVAGPDREWVAEAADVMQRSIGAFAPSHRFDQYLLFGGFGVFALAFVLAVLGADDDAGVNTWELAAIVTAVAGGATLLLSLLATAVLPILELRVEGQRSRREKLTQLGRREGGWLFRTLIAVLLGAGITLLIQWLVGDDSGGH